MSNLSDAKAKYDAVQNALEGIDLEERFPKERYLEEGPDKHEQEDEGIPESIMRMYNNWTYEIIEEKGLDEDNQTRRFLAEEIYNCTSYGMMGVDECHWDTYYYDTLSTNTVYGLTSDPPSSHVVKTLLDTIQPKLALLLDAGIPVEKIVDFIRKTPTTP